MFSRMRDFLSRHRRKFIVSGIVIGSVVLATRYAQRKFREWQERETKEFLERTRRQHHFESTERTCNQTILSLAPTVGEALTKTLDSEDLVGQLRNGHPDRIALWEELKILSFTRASVLVYTGVMLVVTLRIQLNLIGGYMFRDSTNEIVAKPSQVSSALQQKYLSLCHHFMNQGVSELCSLIQQKVRYVLGGMSLKQKLNLRDTEQIFWAVQSAITSDVSDPVKNMAYYLLPADESKPPENISNKDVELLNTMIAETLDMLESEEVYALTSSLVSRGFSQVVDRIAEYFVRTDNSKVSINSESACSTEPIAGPSSQSNITPTVKIKSHISDSINTPVLTNGITSFIHPNNVAMPMAKLIPIVNGLVHQAGRGDNPDPWIQQLILNDKLKLLGANVYEAFSHKSLVK